MYFKEAAAEVIDKKDISLSFKVMMAIAAILIIAVGIYPELVVGWMYH